MFCLRESCFISAPQIEATGACVLQAESPWRTSSAAFQRRRLAGSTRRSRAAQRSRHSRPRRGGHQGLGHSSPGGAQGLSRRRTQRRGGTACCKPHCSASAAWCCHSMLLLFHVILIWCLLHVFEHKRAQQGRFCYALGFRGCTFCLLNHLQCAAGSCSIHPQRMPRTAHDQASKVCLSSDLSLIINPCSQKAEELESSKTGVADGPLAGSNGHLQESNHLMPAASEQPVCLDGAAATGHEALLHALDAPKRRRPQDKTVDLSSESLWEPTAEQQ